MKHCKTLAALFACTLALCLLAACGGGGSSPTLRELLELRLRLEGIQAAYSDQLEAEAKTAANSFTLINSSGYDMYSDNKAFVYARCTTPEDEAENLSYQIISLKTSGINEGTGDKHTHKNIKSIDFYGYTTFTYNGREWIIGLVSFTPTD